MIESVLNTSPELFDIFQKEIWDKKTNVQDLQDALQNIVNAWMSVCDMPMDACQVEIIQFHDDSKKGEFSHRDNKLYLEYEMVINKLGIPYYSDGVPWSNPLSNKETIETLAHEFRHAMQNYFRTHSEQCFDKEYIENVMLNTESQQNSWVNAYFHNKGEVSALLYHLQFVERDAFLFADNFCRKFNEMMRVRYPEDLSFCMHDNFSNFQENVDNAKKVFRTTTPFRDIDDIVRKINHVKPHNALNTRMLVAVARSQLKGWKQRQQEWRDRKDSKFPFDMRPVHEQKQSQNISTDWNVRANRDERGRE